MRSDKLPPEIARLASGLVTFIDETDAAASREKASVQKDDKEVARHGETVRQGGL